MSANRQQPTNQQLQEAKDAWLSKFDGAIAKKTVTFGSPTIRHLHKRTYTHIGRNCHFISVFGRILLGENQISESEDQVYARIKEVETAMERKIQATRAIVADANLQDTTTFNKPEELACAVVVPAQSRYLKVLALADEYLRLMNMLWLEGEITDKAKSKAELELKQNFRTISSVTRKMRVYLQGKLAEAAAKDGASSETKRVLAQAVADTAQHKGSGEGEEQSEVAEAAALAATA